MRAVFHQRDEADLRKGAFAVAGAGPAEGRFQRRVVGDIERAAVEADEAPALEPSALGRRRGDGPHQFVVQAAQRLGAEPGAGLRNAGFSGHLQRRRRVAQPTDALQQATQHLPAGRVHEQRHHDDVIDHHMSRQITLADAGLAGCGQNFVHLADRERLGDDTEADEVCNPASRRQFRCGACHRSGP